MPMSNGGLERVVGVDWSGDKGPGQRRKIWAGVWTAPTGKATHPHLQLESGRTRTELIAWLIELARETDTIRLNWTHRDRPSVFYPDATVAEWTRRVRYVEATGPVHLARLDGSIFAKIADLIVEHQTR